MHKVEILNQINSGQLDKFLKFVRFSKFHLFPNVNNDNIQNYLFELINNRVKDCTVFSYNLNSDIIALAIVHLLDWDTNHFGYKCASIDNVFYNYSADNELLYQALGKIFLAIEKNADLNNIKFMSVSINAEDAIISSTIQSLNYKYILTWIDGIYNSKEKIKINCKNHEFGPVNESEIEYFKDLASKNYFNAGRFYLDRNFDISLVNSMYSDLVSSSYKNHDIMLAYRINNRPVGLFVCKKIVEYPLFNNLRVAPLRFLIVDPEVREKKIGYELFACTLNYLMDKCDIITTGLEVHNLPSLNLHLKLNFKINYAHHVFHWWHS
jgi:hypothetical protein